MAPVTIGEDSISSTSLRLQGLPKVHSHIYNSASATSTRTIVWFFLFLFEFPGPRFRKSLPLPFLAVPASNTARTFSRCIDSKSPLQIFFVWRTEVISTDTMYDLLYKTMKALSCRACGRLENLIHPIK